MTGTQSIFYSESVTVNQNCISTSAEKSTKPFSPDRIIKNLDSDLYISNNKLESKNTQLQNFSIKKLFVSFVKNTVSCLREVAKIIKPVSPLLLFIPGIPLIVKALFLLPLAISFSLDTIEDYRIKNDVEKTQNRNGAKSEKELEDYHKSLLYDENTPDPKKLFKVHFSKQNDKPKPLVILFLGNCQDLEWSDECAGVNKLFTEFKKRDDVDVICFRVGCAKEELMYKLGLSSDPSMHTKIVFEHSSNIIEDLINSRGIFKGRAKPSQVGIAGYSWGGGTVNKLLDERWDKIAPDVKISACAHIDAIKLGTEHMGGPVTKRPKNTLTHFSFHQNNSMLLNGYSLNGSNSSLCIESDEYHHENIDDNYLVVNSIISSFTKMFNLQQN